MFSLKNIEPHRITTFRQNVPARSGNSGDRNGGGVAVQGPVKKQQPNAMSHRAGGWGATIPFRIWRTLPPTLVWANGRMNTTGEWLMCGASS